MRQYYGRTGTAEDRKNRKNVPCRRLYPTEEPEPFSPSTTEEPEPQKNRNRSSVEEQKNRNCRRTETAEEPEPFFYSTVEEPEEPEPQKMGRPALEVPEPDRARRLAMLGLTNEEMAKAFGVARSTFDLWLQKYPDFSGAVNEGKLEADAQVARALYNRAVGVELEEEFVTVRKDANGNPVLLKETVKRRLPPDTMACVYWLNNRTRKTGRWTQSQKLELTGAGGGPILLAPGESAQLTDEELRTAVKLGLKEAQALPRPEDE
jgi:hypothetical protein